MCCWYPVYVRYFNITNKLQCNSTYPDAGYPYQLGASGKSVDSSTEYMYITNKIHGIVVIRLYFLYTLHMFRTVSVHLQEQSFYELNVVSAHTKYDIQLIKKKTAPEDGLIQSETCRAYIENKV